MEDDGYVRAARGRENESGEGAREKGGRLCKISKDRTITRQGEGDIVLRAADGNVENLREILIRRILVKRVTTEPLPAPSSASFPPVWRVGSIARNPASPR